MRLTPQQIEYLSFLIVRTLDKKSLLTAGKKEAAAEAVALTITDDLKVEDELDEEARQILEQYKHEMRRQNIPYHDMLKKIKQKLIAERKLVV